jgi:hypothetical protein
MKESEKELQKTNEWKDELKNMMPFLGHRNWIVVTDMAYPLQSKDAITTLYANEPYIEVVREIKNILSEFPHVTPQIYQDRELSFLNDEICPEIDELKKDVSTALSPLKSRNQRCFLTKS